MRTRRSANEEVAEVARRRLEQLSAELAAVRPDPEQATTAGPWPAPADGRTEDHAAGTGRGAGPDAGPRAGPDDGTGPGRGGGPGRHAHRSLGAAAGLAGWLEDRLPPTLQGRVRMSAAHLGVVAVLVLGGLGLTAWWVSRADGGETVVPPLTSGASPGPGLVGAGGPTGAGSAGTAAGSPSAEASSLVTTAPSGGTVAGGTGSSPTATIVVDVAGKVRRPGIATLPTGSRVVDALESAGGPRRGVRLGSLNLARVLADGEQIVVGVPAPAGVAAGAASAPTSAGGVPMVNINTATQAELEELPDVGPVTARSILDFRAENGTFTAVEELLEVSGIGDATLAKMAPYVTL